MNFIPDSYLVPPHLDPPILNWIYCLSHDSITPVDHMLIFFDLYDQEMLGFNRFDVYLIALQR